MKALHYILPALFLSFVQNTALKAEDSIVNRNVTVEREYRPIIQGAGKINLRPKAIEPRVEKINPAFSSFNLPLDAGFNIHTLGAAELQREKRTETGKGFARVGLGNYFNTLADFAYPLIKTPDMRLDFSLNHLGTFGKKARSTTGANLSFDKYFNNFSLFAGFGGTYDYAKYYGSYFDGAGSPLKADTLTNHIYPTSIYKEQNLPENYRPANNIALAKLASDSIGNSFGRFNLYTGVKSLPSAMGMQYDAKVGYKALEVRNGLIENLLQIDGRFDSEVGENRFGLDFGVENLSYQAHNPAIRNFYKKYTVYTLNPYYSIERTAYDVRIGAKTSFSFDKGHPFEPSADLRAEWRAVPAFFSIYGGITGSHQVNSMDKMFTENPYLMPDMKVEDTYTPIELYMGMKIKPIYNLLLDVFVDYKNIENQYFYTNQAYKCDTVGGVYGQLYSNRFNVLYGNATQLKIGGRANYNISDKLNIRFKGAYNAWDVKNEDFAWYKPRWEADLNAEIRLNEYFHLSGSFFYQSECYAKLGTTAMRMIPKTDINLGVSYLYNDWITLFVKGNNILNKKYQYFYGYDVQGFNALLGASLSF